MGLLRSPPRNLGCLLRNIRNGEVFLNFGLIKESLQESRLIERSSQKPVMIEESSQKPRKLRSLHKILS
jgi:hypothetical protein